ncbi:hypothetical protein [Halomarina litorea]|uniref:hypothetical protein n=1 Tax=Halomarina litorea TaxID=2961595 RepID=UPI0020C37FB7|nr:hypothetical protein [Halomarina sp. BCD28]
MTEPMRLRELVSWVDTGDATHRRLLGSLAVSLAGTGATALAATAGDALLAGGCGAVALAAWTAGLATSRSLRAARRRHLHVALFFLGGAALLGTTLYGLLRGVYPSALFEDAGYTALALTAAALLGVVGVGLAGEAVGSWLSLRGDPSDPEEVIARVLED